MSKRLLKREKGVKTRRHKERLPFTAKNILELCWGLTLNLSHEEPQRELGKTFNEQFTRIINDREDSAEDTLFLENLLMVLAKTVRNIGFIRDEHVRFLDFRANEFAEERQNLNDIADFTSFSGSGLYAKIASFLGVGSVVDLWKGLGYPAVDIPLFFVAGLAGAILVTLSTHLYSKATQKKWEKKIETEQNNYWVNRFKPEMTYQLYILLGEIRVLVEKYYPQNKDEIIHNDELLMMDDEQLIWIIADDILPPDGLTWPPYLKTIAQVPSPQQNAQSEG